MFKRRLLTEDLLQGEKHVYDVINKLTTAREKVNVLEVRWASGEDNSYLFSLFGRLAEIQWMYNEATKRMAEKHLELSKAFKRIFTEEKLLDDAKKELQTSVSKLAKLQKQVESANKKGDHIKAQSMKAEFTTQTTLCAHMTSSVETKAQKQELYKISQLKKALICQAEGVITLSGHCQQLYASQMQLIDLLPDSPVENNEKKDEVERQMTAVVSKVSNLLDIYPPLNGGFDFKTSSFIHSSSGSVSHTTSENIDVKTTVGSPFTGLGHFLKRHKSAENLQIMDPSNHVPAPKLFKPHLHGRHSEDSIRPEVNYTQGMYCEIVIPERDSGVPAIPEGDRIPMRRSQSGSSPLVDRKGSREKHRSAIILDHRANNQILDDGFPEFNTDSETTSIPYSSSEDLGLADDDVKPGYASLTILPSPPRSSPVSPSMMESVEYATPVDVVPLEFNVREQQRRPKKGLTPSPPIPEGKRVSAYESIEGIRREKQKQDIGKKRVVSPNFLREDVVENGKGQPVCGIDEPIYTRPFDAISGTNPLKVTTCVPKNKVNAITPMKRTGSNDKMGKERSAKSFHQTNLQVRDQSSPQRFLSSSPETTSPEEPPRRPVAAKGRSFSAKNSWRVHESATPPPLTKKGSASDIHRVTVEDPQSKGKLPQFVIELENKLKKQPKQAPNLQSGGSSPEPEWRADIGRVASDGALLSEAGLRPTTIRKLKTGQAKLSNGNNLKPMIPPIPMPRSKH